MLICVVRKGRLLLKKKGGGARNDIQQGQTRKRLH